MNAHGTVWTEEPTAAVGRAVVREPETVWLAVGPIAAMALGVALIPFRTLTPASNLGALFVILTIVIAEGGGRAAGLATAVTAALSLNFFLTEPYLTLTINRSDDLVAFIMLALTGLVAAAFGRRRARSVRLLGQARQDLDALQDLADGLATGRSIEALLDGLRRAFRLSGLVVRQGDERLVAAAPASAAARPAPAAALESPTLLDAGRHQRLGHRGFRLPATGGRLGLGSPTDPLWLDLWEGDPEGLSVDERRALVAAAAMLWLALRPGQVRAARAS